MPIFYIYFLNIRPWSAYNRETLVITKLCMMWSSLRQGCNLSPYPFNLYLNYFCKLLDNIDMDPVQEPDSVIKINTKQTFQDPNVHRMSNARSRLGLLCDKFIAKIICDFIFFLVKYLNRWKNATPNKQASIICSNKWNNYIISAF